jgi:diadenosine tetraphosphate (Ap4A) HIT family hydrolase
LSAQSEQPRARNRSHFIVAKTSPPNPAAMVISFRHVETPFDFTVEEWADLREMVIEAKQLLREFHPDGFTMGWNIGAAGGQHVFHAHMHIICRYETDSGAGRGLRDLVRVR